MDENLKTGLVIGVPLALGVTLLVASIVKGQPAVPYQPPVNGNGAVPCSGTEHMEIIPVTTTAMRLTYYDQVMGQNWSTQLKAPDQPDFNVVGQLDHALSLQRITLGQYNCGMAQLSALGY